MYVFYVGTFRQRATGPSSVCVGSSVIFNCTVELSGFGLHIIVSAQWKRDGVVITDNTARHTLLLTEYVTEYGGSPVVRAVMVDNTTLDDNGTVYTCTTAGAPDDFTSNVTLNATGGVSIIALHNVCTVYVYIHFLVDTYIHTYIRT